MNMLLDNVGNFHAYFHRSLKTTFVWDFPGIPVVRTPLHSASAGDMSSVPHFGTKIS